MVNLSDTYYQLHNEEDPRKGMLMLSAAFGKSTHVVTVILLNQPKYSPLMNTASLPSQSLCT